MGVHKSSFTHDEVEILKSLFRLKDSTSGKSEQKRIRDKMRDMGFYISDYDARMGYSGFCRLLSGGIIKVSDDKTESVRPAVPVQSEVADMTIVMLSHLSRGVTGETIYIDSGYHIMG